MTLSGICVRRPVLAFVLAVLITIAGVAGYLQLPLRELPDVDAPEVSISTTYRGASAEVIETRITQPLEDQLAGIEGIDRITSASTDGRSNVNILFKLTRNVDEAANDVRDAVSRAVRNLPPEADPPVVRKANANAQPIIWLNLFSDTQSRLELTDYADRVLLDRFSVLPGVANVRIGGELRYSMRVWLDPVAMAARDITVDDVSRALNTQNLELPAGTIETGVRDFTVRVDRTYKTARDFASLPVRTVGQGAVIRLGDVAKIEEGPEDPDRFFRGNKLDMIGIGISRQSQANDIVISDAVQAEVARIQPILPEGTELVMSYDSAEFTRASVREVYITLFIAIGVVALVNLIFLGSLRASLIPTVVAPISLLGAFALLAALGYSINMLTLLAVVLAVGLVVDDSIVVTENIQRRITKLDEPSLLAADRGARQVFFAVVATTVVLLAGLIPMFMLPGFTGRLFVELAATIAGAVIVSSILSLSLTPMMASKLLRKGLRKPIFKAFDRWMDRVRDRYRNGLNHMVDKPIMVMMAVAVVFVGVGFVFTQLEQELTPNEDRSRVFMFMSGPEGSSFETSVETMKQVEDILEGYTDSGEAKRSLVIVPAFWDPRGNTGFAIVVLNPMEERDRSASEIAGQMQGQLMGITGARLFASAGGGLRRGSTNDQIDFVLMGNQYDQLKVQADTILDEMGKNPRFVRARADYNPNAPRLVVRIDPQKAAAYGVSLESAGRALETLLGGSRTGTYLREGEEYDVLVQAPDRMREDFETLDTIHVRSSAGDMLPLSALIDTRVTADVSERNRTDRRRSITISANLAPGYGLGDAVADLETIVKANTPDAQYDWDGAARDLEEAGSGLAIVFIMALLVVYMALAAQFESLIHPVVILTAAPLALLGGLGSLWLFGSTLNIYSQVGLIILIGVAAKNGVLIVEFANQLRDQGRGVRDAILEAASLRLRPIVMTSVSTAGGALPLILGSGPGMESRFTIGLVLVLGTIVGAFLTLIMVPTLYAFAAPYTKSPEWNARQIKKQSQSQD